MKLDVGKWYSEIRILPKLEGEDPVPVTLTEAVVIDALSRDDGQSEYVIAVPAASIPESWITSATEQEGT